MTGIVPKVLATAEQYRMFAGCTRAVLAVSGGPDSLCLLHVMSELRERHFPGMALHVGHLHHGMRGAEADEDARLVAETAHYLQVECTVEHCNVPQLAYEHGEGEEAAGRRARYDFLGRLAMRTGASRIVTGHHADDQAETVLMRVMRGAGPRGMGGIPPVRPHTPASDVLIVRPLIDCTRAEIEAFVAARGITPRLDRTNLSDKYLRNRVRRRIMPLLERDWDGDLRHHLCTLARASRGLKELGCELTHLLTSRHEVVLEPQYVETSTDWLHDIPPELLPELVRYWMEEAGLWQKTLNQSHYESIYTLAATATSGHAAVALPGPALACRSGDVLVLCAESGAAVEQFSAKLAVPGTTPVPPLEMHVEARVIRDDLDSLLARIRQKDPLEEFLDWNALAQPLTLRFPQPGDRMRALGAPGRRKLQDILTDLHVPRMRRRRTLLLMAGDTPVWIAGQRIAETSKVTSATQEVLWLRLVRDRSRRTI